MADYEYYVNDAGSPVRLRVPEFIRGTNTAAGAALTGVTKDAALYEGKHIFFRLAYAAANNATLNLTLADGTTTGAIPVFFSGGTRLSTHFGAGQIISMTYMAAENRWQVDGDYYQTNTTGNLSHSSYIKAQTACTNGHIIVGKAGTGYNNLAEGITYDVAVPPLMCTGNIAAGGNSTAASYAVNSKDPTVNNGCSGLTFATFGELYIVGTLADGVVTVVSPVLTTTIPTADDGKVYHPVGEMSNSNTAFNFFTCRQLFAYRNGKFGPLEPDLSTYATKAELPTKTSDLTNDSGFLTSHQDISGKANTADLATVATSGSYNDLTDKPTIPAAANPQCCYVTSLANVPSNLETGCVIFLDTSSSSS